MSLYDNIENFITDTIYEVFINENICGSTTALDAKLNDFQKWITFEGSLALEGLSWSLQDIGSAFWGVFAEITSSLAIMSGVGSARSEPDLEKIRQKAWGNERIRLLPSDLIYHNYRNGNQAGLSIENWLKKSGYPENALTAVNIQAGLTLDYREWINSYRKQYASDPPESMLFERFGIGAENYQFILGDTENLLPLDSYVLYEIRNFAYLDIENVGETFASIGPADYGKSTKEYINEYLNIQGITNTSADVLLDSFGNYPNPTEIVRALLLYDFTEKEIFQSIIQAGGHPNQAWIWQDIARYVPNPADLTMVLRRWDYDPDRIEAELKKIATHPNYIDVVKEATKYYPSVQDLITMAVREVFTPEIAEQFGQFDDYPVEFENAAKRAGLDPEWSKNYWAAHWALPAVQQGFDMLHRGHINMDELNMLLRASDVMPFWREKLTQIAYRVPGRIDVRRMYKLGVYDIEQVYYNYLDLGYSEIGAESMTLFTHAFVMEQLTGFNAKDVFKSYKAGLLTRNDATDILLSLGTTAEHIDIGIERTDLEWSIENTQTRIKLVKEKFLRGVNDEAQTYAELGGLYLSENKINFYITNWKLSRLQKQRVLTKRIEGSKNLTPMQTVKAYKANLLDEEETLHRLTEVGYNRKDAEILLVIGATVTNATEQ